MSDRLPADGLARSLELVRRSAPSPSAPPTNLPPDLDQTVRQRESGRAVLYAQLDDLSDRCDRLAIDIETSGVVLDVMEDDDDSLVSSIDGLAQAAAAAAR